MKNTTTLRGFSKIEFTDTYGAECSIQKSSLATEDRIWIGVNDADPKIMASNAAANGVKTTETTGWVPYPIPEDVLLNTRMHLNREQVSEMLPYLSEFVRTGRLVTPENELQFISAEETITALATALRDLHDAQNGPPLERDRDEWQAAMDRAGEVLDRVGY